mmetsp:Transcript_18340/g.32442  ORF Transcript_18340/g.32442 Transcript_18340/m.32442 type:complete len:168 (-) Transcript_18340:471-974(-)
MTEVTVKGTCLCGACVVEATLPFTFSCICHCTICQRLGGTCSHWIGFAKENVKMVKGEDNLNQFSSSDGMVRHRCATCGSAMYGEAIKYADFRDVPRGILERDEKGNTKHLEHIAPTAHIFYPSRCFDMNDSLPKYIEFGFNSKELNADGSPKMDTATVVPKTNEAL